MLRKFINLSFMVVALLLSACSGKFHCASNPGVRCKSVSEVNRMVDEGILPSKAWSYKPCQKKPSWFKKSQASSENEPEPNHKTLTIWLAPFFDASGIAHSEAYLQVNIPETTGAY